MHLNVKYWFECIHHYHLKKCGYTNLGSCHREPRWVCPFLCLQSSDSALSACLPNDDRDRDESMLFMLESPTHWAGCFMHLHL